MIRDDPKSEQYQIIHIHKNKQLSSNLLRMACTQDLWDDLFCRRSMEQLGPRKDIARKQKAMMQNLPFYNTCTSSSCIQEVHQMHLLDDLASHLFHTQTLHPLCPQNHRKAAKPFRKQLRIEF